jgi:predicted MPP superfamily phosphohydrolase
MRSYRRTVKEAAGRGARIAYRSARRLGLEPAYRLAVRIYQPTPSAWPASLPLSVAAIADLHFGEPYLGLERLKMIVDATNAAEPDLIVLLGDYGATHHDAAEHRAAMEVLAQKVRRLSAPLGVFAVMGNHDWSADGLARARGQGPPVAGQALGQVGVAVLENDAVRLQHRGQEFWLAGLGDQLAQVGARRGLDDLCSTVDKITDGSPAILLAHEPDIFPVVPSRFALTLAGHTHGGQIRIFGYAPYVPSRYGQRYLQGHVVEDDRHLIVSAGLGVTHLPLRIGVPPEIVLVRLGDRPSPSPGAPMTS